MMKEKPGIRGIPLKDKLTIGSILLISLVGSLLIVYSTSWGPWVFSDSTEYLFSARNLIAGHGLGLYSPTGVFHPMVLHPPFYSLLLSLFGWMGIDLVAAARWINVILFGSTILLMGLSIYAFTHSSWLAIISSILVFSMPALIDINSGAMSEPLFIFTGLASISLILLFLRNNHRSVLLAAAFAASLSLFTRFVGLAFIIAGITGLLVFSPRTWKKRITDSFIFGLVSSLPIIGWLAWLKFQSIILRSIQPEINLGDRLTKFRLGVMEIFWSWLPFNSLLPPYSYNLAKNLLIISIFLTLILLSLTVWKVHKNKLKIFNLNHGLFFVGMMGVYTIAYLIILTFSYVYTNPAPDLNNRTLLPVQIAFLLGFFILSHFFIRAWSSIKWLTLIPILLAAGISISYLDESLDIVSQYHQSGSGYTGRVWRASGTIQAIEQLPSNISLISNDSAALLFYTGRPAYDISELTNNQPLMSFPTYGDDPSDPAQIAFRENGAGLVLFNSSRWQFQRLYGDQTTKRLDYFTRGLSLYAQSWDGAIYFYNPTGK